MIWKQVYNDWWVSDIGYIRKVFIDERLAKKIPISPGFYFVSWKHFKKPTKYLATFNEAKDSICEN